MILLQRQEQAVIRVDHVTSPCVLACRSCYRWSYCSVRSRPSCARRNATWKTTSTTYWCASWTCSRSFCRQCRSQARHHVARTRTAKGSRATHRPHPATHRRPTHNQWNTPTAYLSRNNSTTGQGHRPRSAKVNRRRNGAAAIRSNCSPPHSSDSRCCVVSIYFADCLVTTLQTAVFTCKHTGTCSKARCTSWTMYTYMTCG